MEYYLYILKSNNSKRFYRGITNNLSKRIRQHELGQCLTTKQMIPFELVYVHVCKNRPEARQLKKYFKSGSGREIISELVGC